MAEGKFDKTILSEDGTFNFDFMTSLQNIVIAKIINHLWMNRNIQQDIVNLYHSYIQPDLRGESNEWQQIKNNVISKVSDLPLPTSIANKLTDIVPLVGQSVIDWIWYHERILNIDGYSTHSAVDLINNIAWTARGKIDYGQTAKNILANKKSFLSDDHKYKLACTYCLEDEIYALSANVINEDYLDNVEIYSMVYFWTTHITRDNVKLYSHHRDNIQHNNIPINEYIKQLLTERHSSFNEVPIKYMWGKLSEEEKAKNIVSFVQKLRNQDLRYILLSNLSYEQQQEVFKEHYGFIILKDILNDWLWSDYFLPITLYIFDIVSFVNRKNYFYILEEINKKMVKNFEMKNYYVYNQFKKSFKKIWQESSRHCKDLIFLFRTIKVSLIFSLSWERDMDIIELIFSDYNEQEKKNLFFGFDTINRFGDLIINDKLDLLELFIRCVFSSEDDINQLKVNMIRFTGYKIAEHFLEHETLDKLEHFLSWVSTSEEEIDKFRKSLTSDVILKSFTSNNKLDFMKLENHYKWCAKGDLEVINQFKSESPNLYAAELINKLIEEDQYESLDQFLNWCFLDNQQKVAQFKCNMYKDLPYVKVSILNLIKKDNSFELLDKFIRWCFSNEQDVQEFKTWLLYPHENNLSICAKLILHQLMIADKFIKWCCNSSEAVSVFKNAFILSSEIEYVIVHTRNTPDHLKLLIKLFNPSIETIQKFTENLILKNSVPDSFYEWLDKFIKSRNLLIAHGDENALQESQANLESQCDHNDAI